MYDDERLRPRLTGDMAIRRRRRGYVAEFPVDGRLVRADLPAGLVPPGTPAMVDGDATLARVILGLLLDDERAEIVRRPPDDADLWVASQSGT